MTKNKSSLQAKKKAASLKLRKTAGFWRRVRDSNPRSLSEHDFSRVAPSTTRTTLQYISKHQVSEIPRKKERTDGENNGYSIVKLTHKNESYQRFRSLAYHISLSVSSQNIRPCKNGRPPVFKIVILFQRQVRRLQSSTL